MLCGEVYKAGIRAYTEGFFFEAKICFVHNYRKVMSKFYTNIRNERCQ
jgi:hypothetical protein